MLFEQRTAEEKKELTRIESVSDYERCPLMLQELGLYPENEHPSKCSQFLNNLNRIGLFLRQKEQNLEQD